MLKNENDDYGTNCSFMAKNGVERMGLIIMWRKGKIWADE